MPEKGLSLISLDALSKPACKLIEAVSSATDAEANCHGNTERDTTG
jgi:hypothetical protein